MDLLDAGVGYIKLFSDYKELLKVLPPDSSLLPQLRTSLGRIAPRREAAQKAEMGEMMDKLKGLGNSLLGSLCFRFLPHWLTELWQEILVFQLTISNLNQMDKGDTL